MSELLRFRQSRIGIALTLAVLFSVGLLVLLMPELGVVTGFWATIANVVGGLLAVSVVATLIYDLVLREYDDHNRMSELRALLDQKLDAALEGSMVFGFRGLCPTVDIKSILCDLGNGDELWWLNTFVAGHQTWLPELREAVERGARIRILAIDPNSDAATSRALELREYNPGSYRGDLEAFVRDLRELAKSTDGQNDPGRLEIACYSDLPGTPIYVVCKSGRLAYAFTSFFLNIPTGVRCPHLRWEPSRSGLSDQFLDYVKLKWEHTIQSGIR